MTISLPAIFKRRTGSPRRSGLANSLKRKWRPYQTVLLLGDDGYRVTVLDRQRRLKTLFVQAGEDGRAMVRDWLQHHKIRSLRIVCDQTGQSYAREEVPKASRRDQTLILKRRLDTSFGKGALTTWLAIEDTTSPPNGTDESLSGKPYLLAALADESGIQPWLDELADARIEVTSIGLLPLEWAAALPLALGLSKEELEGAVWRVVVTRHRTGGIRHVVLRGDQLVLTRLTPDYAVPAAGGAMVENAGTDSVASNGVVADHWTRRLLAEVEASIGYIKRFGYTADQKLVVSLVGGDAFADLVHGVNRASTNQWHAHHIGEVADRLLIALPFEEEQLTTECGDCLIAAMMMALPVRHSMSSPAWLERRQRRRQEGLARATMVLAIAGLTGLSGWLGWQLNQQLAREQRLRAELTDLEQAHAQILEQTADLPQGLNDVRNFLHAFDRHYAFEQGWPEFYQAILQTLGPKLKLDHLSWFLNAQAGEDPVTRVDLGLDLRRAHTLDEARRLVDGFVARLTDSQPRGRIELGEIEVPLDGTMPTSGSWSADQPADGEIAILAGRIALLVSDEN